MKLRKPRIGDFGWILFVISIGVSLEGARDWGLVLFIFAIILLIGDRIERYYE